MKKVIMVEGNLALNYSYEEPKPIEIDPIPIEVEPFEEDEENPIEECPEINPEEIKEPAARFTSNGVKLVLVK